LEAVDFGRLHERYNILGFIRHGNEQPDTFGGYPVLGGPEVLADYPRAKILPGYGYPERDNRSNWITVTAPTAFIASSAKIGKGCVIFPNCYIGANAVLGDGILMLSGSAVNHDCEIEDHATITSRVALAGHVKVKTGAYLGQSCTVRQFLTLGAGCTVGMGAVVTKDVAEKTTVIGNPARLYP
jgi:sugar O-acyltransferase (sialic acid O-acetyltransferase NeuD family)